MIGLTGKKCGMTRVFQADGRAIPVTVVHVEENRVVCIKTKDKDGYDAIQITTGEKKAKKVNKPMAGHYKKANVKPGRLLCEFRLENEKKIDPKTIQVGQVFGADWFSEGQFVDVTGITKGKGYAGVIKRYHFSSQDASHGNSLSHRAPGSIGQRQTPGRVMKGKRMAGHLGVDQRTVLNQKVIKVDKEKGLLFIEGAIPGNAGGEVVVMPAVKKLAKQKGAAHGA